MYLWSRDHSQETTLMLILFLYYSCSVDQRVSVSTVRRSYASAVIGVVIPSRLSVCHTRALRQNQTMHCGYFDITRMGNHFGFLTPTVVGGWRPLPSEICTQSDPSLFEKRPLRQISAYNVSTRVLSRRPGFRGK